MSDGGDFDFVSRHSRRQEIALGGAATLSSLYFRKPSHKTVDDAGIWFNDEDASDDKLTVGVM